jgi:hypothetical protein
MSEMVGINELARRLKISRLKLTELANAGKIPFMVGKHNLRVFSVDSVIRALEREMEHGTRSLQSHQAGGDGQRPAEVAETQADREGVR